MALIHAQPLDVISLKPLAEKIHQVKTHSLLKTGHLQLMRLVMAAGQTMPQHDVAGEITIQCLEGSVLITTPGRSSALAAGRWRNDGLVGTRAARFGGAGRFVIACHCFAQDLSADDSSTTKQPPVRPSKPLLF